MFSVSWSDHRNAAQALQAEKQQEYHFAAGNVGRVPDQARLNSSAPLTVRPLAVTIPTVTLRPEADKFLRAAVKTGLRLQQSDTAESDGAKGTGVRTLQRIKASLRKRTSKTKANL